MASIKIFGVEFNAGAAEHGEKLIAVRLLAVVR
jgi:hypothetical protein